MTRGLRLLLESSRWVDPVRRGIRRPRCRQGKADCPPPEFLRQQLALVAEHERNNATVVLARLLKIAPGGAANVQTILFGKERKL